MRGFIYVASNPAMPGVFKIGYSTNTPDIRLAELSATTSIPTPFSLEYFILVSEGAYDYEQSIHSLLSSHRLNKNREFFSVSLDEIIVTIEDTINSNHIEGRSFSGNRHRQTEDDVEIWRQLNAKRIEDEIKEKAKLEAKEKDDAARKEKAIKSDRFNELTDWMKRHPEPSIFIEKKWRKQLGSWVAYYMATHDNHHSAREDLLQILGVSSYYPVGIKKFFGSDTQEVIQTWKTLGFKYLGIEITGR